MADVMKEFSSSNGEVDDLNDEIKLNGDASGDASSIAANSPSRLVDDELDSISVKKLDCSKDADSDLISKLHDQQNNINCSPVANGRVKTDALSSSANNDIDSSKQNDNCDDATTKTANVSSEETNCDEASNERVVDNCDSDKAESDRQSNCSLNNDLDHRKDSDQVSDLSITAAKEDSSANNAVYNSQSSSCSISIVSENGAKDDVDEVVATDLSKRAVDVEKKTNASTNGGDEDDEANEDDEVISISSTPDRGNKKSSKKPSMSIVNITPRRSSRNLNKQQKCYTEKDAEFESSGSDGISIIPSRKRVAGSSGDDEIVEITPTDPLAEEPHRPSAAKMRNKTIVVSDTKGLVEFASNTKASRSNKKEPTLVIIDTNSILSGRGPIPVSQHGGSNSMLHSSSSSSTPIPVSLPIPAGAFANASRGSGSSSSAFSVIPIGLPAGLPAQGMYSQYKNPPPAIKPIVVGAPSTSVTPVPMASTTSSSMSATTITTVASTQPVNKQPQVVLPSLTDDMFVVEAPSFIVPYVYEKPPMKSLKEHIEKIETDIKKAAAEEAEREKQERSESKDTAEKTPSNEGSTEEKNESNDLAAASSEDKTDKEAETNDKEQGSGDASKESGESTTESQTKEQDKSTEKKEGDVEPMEVDGEDKQPTKPTATPTSVATLEPETISNNIVKKMELDSPANAVKEIEKKITAGPTTGTDDPKKPASYFENPLGKFFMQIGLNLVQEHVQTDLLRSQKRKRDKEGTKCSPDVHSAIDELTKTLESSKENNDPFKLELKKCELCSFKTESLLVMAHHLETPHMKNYTYRCNFCPLEVRSPHDILFHMEAEHNIRGRLERAPAFHQCPNCPFEDNQKGKLTRHLISCSKKYRPERNQEPPLDWEPPAKIPRVTRNRPPSMSPGNAVYQAAMSGLKQVPQNTLLPKLMPSATNMKHSMMNTANKRPNVGNAFLNRFPNAAANQPNFQQRPISMPTSNQGMMFRTAATNSQTPVLLPQGYHLSGAQIYQTQTKNSQAAQQNLAAAKLLNQPSISITPLPRQSTSNNSSSNAKSSAGKPMNALAGATKNAGNFVVCEICDGYIKDLEQLRNHMQWIHKVKIHPKMIYNRPPLNCQKCQERFFTDQGLERHLLGAHGLVTSSMQEAANKGKDGGRCPVCGRVYQWKLLNHVARDHQMALKPAHLSYKCTVCTATFGMYKQFESHVYSAHSVVAKRAMDTSKKPPPAPSASQNETLLKPLKINDEITIIPQPPRSTRPSNSNNKESNSATITKTVTNSKKMDRENDDDDSGSGTDDDSCKRICSQEDFDDTEAFRKHVHEKHVKNFKIILSRLDVKSLNRIPNKENAFKLTKFDRNSISNEIRSTYKLDDFFIEIKRLKLSSDCRYKVVENRQPVQVDESDFEPDLVPEAVYLGVEPDSCDKTGPNNRGRVSTVNTTYVKRKIESLLATSTLRSTPSKVNIAPASATMTNRIAPASATLGRRITLAMAPPSLSNRTVPSSAAMMTNKVAPVLSTMTNKTALAPATMTNRTALAPATMNTNVSAFPNYFNGGKQKKLMTRGRRNATRQNVRKRKASSSDSNSSSDDDFDFEERRAPLSSQQNTTSESNPFNDHFMSGLSAFAGQTNSSTRQNASFYFSSSPRGSAALSRRTITTTTTRNNAPAPVRQSAVRGRSSKSSYAVVNQRTVTMSSSSTTFGNIASKTTPATNAQFCKQRSVKVTKRVTTYHPNTSALNQSSSKPSRPQVQKVGDTPQAVISLLSDSDSESSVVEIVERDPTVRNTDDNEVYILPT